jgi:hydrogenase maturation factor
MDGILTCARYAFSPNFYKYCGPDANRNIAAYLKEDTSDPGLSSYLSEFAVLYPYLKLIAHENGISDPFDERVVEAYWVGNDLLEHVGEKQFAEHLSYGQRLKDRLAKKKLRWIIEKVPKGVRVHHSFHVFSVLTRTGHHAVAHTLDTMDSCRIGWGKIIATRIKNKELGIKIKTQKLNYKDGKLRLKAGVKRKVSLPVNNDMQKKLKPGDRVSYHWGFVCDKISKTQAEKLDYYTNLNLNLANETI